MANTAETVNAMIDNLLATGWRLLDLPMFMLVVPAVVAGAGVAFFMRRRWRQVAFIETGLLLFALVFVADRKIALIQGQLDALRARSTADTAVAIQAAATTRPAAQFSVRQKSLIDVPHAQAVLAGEFKQLTLKSLIYDAATDVVQFHSAEPLAQAYIAIVDLKSPGVQIDIGGSLAGKSLTSAFARQNQCTVAINGEAGMSPDAYSGLGFWSGAWIERGKLIQSENAGNPKPYLYFGQDNHAGFISSTERDRKPSAAIFNLLWGRLDAVVNGVVQTADERNRQPRTAMAINQDGSHLYLLVVDGRQPQYSMGFTRAEVGTVLKAMGAWNGMLCDEGGSSCMYLKQFGGVCNIPSDNQGEERPTYTHFGISVKEMSQRE